MKIHTLKLIGILISLVGIIIAIIVLIPGLPAIMAWTYASDNQTIISGYLILTILIAWIIAIIGVFLGFLTKEYGGLFFISAAGICLGIFLYCFIISFESPNNSVYSFVRFPYSGLLYLFGGIITILGEKKI